MRTADCERSFRWEGTPSAILSTAHFLVHCEAPVRARLLLPSLLAIMPWTMHHHNATRQAIWTLQRLFIAATVHGEEITSSLELYSAAIQCCACKTGG